MTNDWWIEERKRQLAEERRQSMRQEEHRRRLEEQRRQQFTEEQQARERAEGQRARERAEVQPRAREPERRRPTGPLSEYQRFKAAVEATTFNAFSGPRQQRLAEWLQKLLNDGDPDAHADVEREWRQDLQIPGSLTDAEDWPDDVDETDGIDVPADAPLYGWRFWYAIDGRLVAPYLTSKTGVSDRHHTARWRPGINTSSDLHCHCQGPHPGPDPRCGCGIRAMASYRLIELLLRKFPGRNAAPLVIGRVAIWGRIAGRAYADDPPATIRATHARLDQLWVEDDDELEAELRATYAVPETDPEEES